MPHKKNKSKKKYPKRKVIEQLVEDLGLPKSLIPLEKTEFLNFVHYLILDVVFQEFTSDSIGGQLDTDNTNILGYYFALGKNLKIRYVSVDDNTDEVHSGVLSGGTIKSMNDGEESKYSGDTMAGFSRQAADKFDVCFVSRANMKFIVDKSHLVSFSGSEVSFRTSSYHPNILDGKKQFTLKVEGNTPVPMNPGIQSVLVKLKKTIPSASIYHDKMNSSVPLVSLAAPCPPLWKPI